MLQADVSLLAALLVATYSSQMSPNLSDIQQGIIVPQTSSASRLHADFTSPFLGSMFSVLMDAHSKWIEVHSLPSITAATTIQCFRRIFATFGLPEVIVTDNGSTFTSAEFNSHAEMASNTRSHHPTIQPLMVWQNVQYKHLRGVRRG